MGELEDAFRIADRIDENPHGVCKDFLGTAILCIGMVALIVVCEGCMKRAPTNYELDRRAGMATPPPQAEYASEREKKKARRANPTWNEPLWTSSTLAPAAMMPARVQPVVRKVWVPDQLLEDGSWLQGTWMFVEVEPAHWLPEVDPGGAPFAVHPGESGPQTVEQALNQALEE